MTSKINRKEFLKLFAGGLAGVTLTEFSQKLSGNALCPDQEAGIESDLRDAVKVGQG